MTASKGEWTIGIDLGATNLRGGLIDRAGKPIARDAMPLGSDKSPTAVIAKIADLVGHLRKKGAAGSVRAVGCGVPGIVDGGRGIVFSSPNLSGWKDVPVRDLLAKAIGLPLVIDNDANMHAMGEACFGAGVGHRNMVLLTLGSGIGGGIILDGKIFHGDEGFAGEVGHIVVEPDGVPCGCGGRGCWEQYAASRAFRVFAERLPADVRARLLAEAGTGIDGLTPELMARLADAGNAEAVELWQMYGRYLGVGIATLLNVLGVTTFIVGGGIARSFDRFIDAARASALSHTYARHAARLLLARAQLGDDAGIVGAACSAFSAVP